MASTFSGSAESAALFNAAYRRSVMQQESVAISWVEIALFLAAAFVAFGLFFSNLNPLWQILESWPRTLDGLSLHGKCFGFLMAGLPGGYWRFVECLSGDEITILKTSGAGEPEFEIRVASEDLPTNWSEEYGEVAKLSLGSSGVLRPTATPGAFAVSCSDPIRLVALIRSAALSLGHDPACRYRTYSRGPNDEHAIKSYMDSLK